MIARWPVWRLSGGWAWLVLFGVWALLAWGLGRAFDWAYLASIRVSWAGPTLLFAFLFLRHLALGHPRRERAARLSGCALACALSAWLAVQADLAYEAMHDAPRGLLWDLDVVVAPLLGLVAILVARLVVNPATLLARTKASAPGPSS